MIRFACVCVISFALAACSGSSQAIPTTPGSSVASGYMRTTFRVAGKLDFSKYEYVIVFDTSGKRLTPEAGTHSTNWAAYSAALQTASTEGAAYVQAVAYVRNKNPHVPPAVVRLNVKPSQLQFVPDDGGGGSAFAITFERSIFGADASRLATSWRFNAFSLRRRALVDSMGRCGSCFRSPALPVSTSFARVVDAQTPKAAVPPSARIVSLEFENNP
jgi:hypothetical protein